GGGLSRCPREDEACSYLSTTLAYPIGTGLRQVPSRWQLAVIAGSLLALEGANDLTPVILHDRCPATPPAAATADRPLRSRTSPPPCPARCRSPGGRQRNSSREPASGRRRHRPRSAR